jgi:hypothetical protein
MQARAGPLSASTQRATNAKTAPRRIEEVYERRDGGLSRYLAPMHGGRAFGRRAARASAIALLAGLASISAGPAALGSDNDEAGKNLVRTDGHLRPGHLETIRIQGYPGRGTTEVGFFPTAICGKECGSVGRKGTPTDAHGAATLRVRVPGTFYNHRGGRTYFRDRERIEVVVSWEGTGDDDFDVGYANPDPIIVRTHPAPQLK